MWKPHLLYNREVARYPPPPRGIRVMHGNLAWWHSFQRLGLVPNVVLWKVCLCYKRKVYLQQCFPHRGICLLAMFALLRLTVSFSRQHCFAQVRTPAAPGGGGDLEPQLATNQRSCTNCQWGLATIRCGPRNRSLIPSKVLQISGLQDPHPNILSSKKTKHLYSL